MHRALFDCIDHGIFFVGEVLAAIDLKKVEIRQRYDRIILINYSYKIAVANSLVLRIFEIWEYWGKLLTSHSKRKK